MFTKNQILISYAERSSADLSSPAGNSDQKMVERTVQLPVGYERRHVFPDRCSHAAYWQRPRSHPSQSCDPDPDRSASNCQLLLPYNNTSNNKGNAMRLAYYFPR